MKTTELLHNLNNKQIEAVTAEPGHLLILAGAGSGKTRVLAHRIAWLMNHYHASPYTLLAVTFTNKAAYQMRERIESLCGSPMGSMWIGTFHGLAHRLLRHHWKEADLIQSFQILDSDDQLRLIKRIHKNLQLEESKWPPKQSQWFINKCKDDGLRPHHLRVEDYYTEVMQRIYFLYEELCQQSGLVDFAELLLRSLELLQKNIEIRDHYQKRFQHLLVDEFQDTNAIQYQWLRMLTGSNSYMMAVGDDDQSIYSWRGAKIENIHRFTQDFANCITIRLEQNYRSTATILQAANAVITHNKNRLGKTLWTSDNSGESIKLYAAFNEYDEAHYVVSTIKEWVKEGYALREVAVLYRSNAQSRILEEQLIEAQVPYHIYGGLKFFERAEIKDALAYLRLLANPHDDAAFERVINTPARGIGNTTLAKLREIAKEKHFSLWHTSEFIIQNKELPSRALHALNQFLNIINRFKLEFSDKSLEEQTYQVINQSGLLEFYQKDKTEKSISRVENLEELINATQQFQKRIGTSDTPALHLFLAHVALEMGEEQVSKTSDGVHLMTLHAAKGLEFPIVFITGMEEELFPHRMSIQERQGLEEERRLCYVGMTRAMHKLYLCYSETRRMHGMEKINHPSRFINEIPSNLIEPIRTKAKVSQPFPTSYSRSSLTFSNKTGLQLGQRVSHPKFGEGFIISFEGRDEYTRIQVRFDKNGEKWLVASFANLTPA